MKTNEHPEREKRGVHLRSNIAEFAKEERASVFEIISAFSRVGGPGKTAASLTDRLHALRVQTKRLNALLELMQPFLEKGVYRTAKKEVRKIRRRFSAQRDAEVIRKLLEESAGKLPTKKMKEVRRWMEREFPKRRRQTKGEEIENAYAELREEGQELAKLSLPEDDLVEVCKPGLRRLYAKSQKKIRGAELSRKSGDFHEARQWIKLLKLSLDECHSAGIDVPRKMLKQLGALEQELGRYHDCALAMEARFHKKKAAGELRQLVTGERRELEQRALKRAKELFKKKPSAFVEKALGH